MYRLNLSVLFKGAGKSSALFARYFSQPTTTHTFPPAAKKNTHASNKRPSAWGSPRLPLLVCPNQKKKKKQKQGGAQQHDWNFPVQTFFAQGSTMKKNCVPALLLCLRPSWPFIDFFQL